MKTLLITGASGAIGAALAETYATAGVRLILQGRDRTRLAAVRARCEQAGARVRCEILDLSDPRGVKAWAEDLDREEGVDLLIANAGRNTAVGEEGEDWEAVMALIDINLRASIALAQGVLPGMRARGRGQIALVSSLAAYHGLPMTPTYCATKAALKAYGEGLRAWLAPRGIRINVVMPGYVDSPMCRAMPGPKPFRMTPARAAAKIRRGLAHDRPRIAFPWPLALATWCLAALPEGLSQRLLPLFGYRV